MRLYGVFGLARDSLHQEAPEIALQPDFVIIDGPPRVAALADQPFAALDAEVCQRIVFVDSVAAGRLAREVTPQGAATREIAAPAQAVREALQ